MVRATRLLLMALVMFTFCASQTPATTVKCTFTTLDIPDKARVEAISGNVIVGHDSKDLFLYDGSSYTLLSQGSQTGDAHIAGISGSEIVGCREYWADSTLHHCGFIYDGSTYTNFHHWQEAAYSPDLGSGTHFLGISGKNIVGYYDTWDPDDGGLNKHGFLYNGTYNTLELPGGSAFIPVGISGGYIVGSSLTDNCYYLYDGSVYTKLQPPPKTFKGYDVVGISGNLIIGIYWDSSYTTHGFLYDGSTYMTIDDPLLANPKDFDSTYLVGISDNTIAGYSIVDGYKTLRNFTLEFKIIAPEPSVFVLMSIGAIAGGGYAWLRRKRRA